MHYFWASAGRRFFFANLYSFRYYLLENIKLLREHIYWLPFVDVTEQLVICRNNKKYAGRHIVYWISYILFIAIRITLYANKNLYKFSKTKTRTWSFHCLTPLYYGKYALFRSSCASGITNSRASCVSINLLTLPLKFSKWPNVVNCSHFIHNTYE